MPGGRGRAVINGYRRAPAPASNPGEANGQLFELNPNPTWIFDEATLQFLAVNDAAVSLYGWPRREFLRLSVKDIRPAAEVPRFLRGLARHREPAATFTAGWRHQKRDGTIFQAEVTLRRLRFHGREARLGTVQDVTERKQTEARLRRLNTVLESRVVRRTRELTAAVARSQAVTDTALVGILTLDAQGTVESLNPAAVEIFGVPAARAVGARVGGLMSLPGRPRGTDFLHFFLRAGRDDRGEIGVRCRDGRVLTLELSVTEFTVDGRAHYVAVMRDITQRKWLERALLEISERERLRIGHDLHDGLGQQLHGLAYLAALLEQNLREDGSPRLTEAGQLNAYLREALGMTRSLARGLQPVESVPQGLMMALRALAERVSRLFRVECRFASRPFLLVHRQTAAAHLFRIAQEAVNNATKHGHPTRIRILVAAARDTVVLAVRDDGAGIRLRGGRGRGMGLHIMRHRADALGGTLVVRRRPRGGTEVVCTVPRDSLRPDPNARP